jgi:hypothetical protein
MRLPMLVLARSIAILDCHTRFAHLETGNASLLATLGAALDQHCHDHFFLPGDTARGTSFFVNGAKKIAARQELVFKFVSLSTGPRPATMSTMKTSAAALIITLLLFHSSSTWVISYQHTSCHRTLRRAHQFQFPNCYTYDLNPNLYISDASFVMAHNAATGYIHNRNDRTFNTNGKTSTNVWNKNDITLQLLSLYGKTQVGTAYQQLNDGARALDLRPKLYTNGTVGFHHGSLIDVPLTSLTLGRLLQDVKQWCYDNPTELVLLFHSELVHESGIDGLSSLVKYSANMDENYDDDGNNDVQN